MISINIGGLIALCLLLGGILAARGQTNVVEGWTVVVNERLLAEEKAATEKALEILRGQLKEIVRVLPAPALAKLREVTLWFSPEYAGVKPKAEYHPGVGWLRENRRDAAMVKGIEFTDIKNFEAEARRMPNFTLHELAHAYHHRVLPDGFDNAEIKPPSNARRRASRTTRSSAGLAMVSRTHSSGPTLSPIRRSISPNRRRPISRATISSPSRARS